MENTVIKQIYASPENYSGKQIKICGWVRTIRSSKVFGFMELNDGSFFKSIQVVFEDKLENFDEISKFIINSTVGVEGELVLTPDAKQPFEIHASKVTLEGKSNTDYPLQKRDTHLNI